MTGQSLLQKNKGIATEAALVEPHSSVSTKAKRRQANKAEVLPQATPVEDTEVKAIQPQKPEGKTASVNPPSHPCSNERWHLPVR